MPTINTGTTEFWVLDGIIYGKTLPDAPQRELSEAVSEVAALLELTGGEPMPLLFDARNLGWMQMDARKYIQSNAKKVFTRAAIVAMPERAELMAYALKESQTVMPVEVFTDDEAAWRFAAEGLEPSAP